MFIHKIAPKFLTTPFHIGIVKSRFNFEITDQLCKDALEIFNTKTYIGNIMVVEVAGAIEIPFTLQRLAHTKQYDALIAFGAVIYGETHHYHYVCNQVSQGCQRVMLEESIPVIFGVLTTKTLEQAKARAFGQKEFFGKQVAHTALEMISIARQII